MPVWDVAARPGREQFAFWREVICEAFVPLTPVPARAAPDFPSRVETRPLAGVVRARLASQAQRTVHGRGEVARTDGAYVFVNLQTAGTCAVEQGGRRSVVRPGQFTVVDTTEPYSFDFDRSWAMASYRVPHELLGGRLDDLRARTAGCWDARGAGAVVAAVMASMWDLDDGAAEVSRVAVDVQDVLVAALSAAGAERGGVPADRHAVLRAEVRREVERHLADPALSAAVVGRRLGVSARTLHEAVSAGGETFAAMVRRRRLERAATLLAHGPAGTTVTQVAASVGFAGPGSFSRAFRREFGRSPREVRGTGVAVARNAPSSRTE